MASVVVKDGESLDSALRRFKKKVISEGIMQQLRDREYYVSKSQKRRAAKKAAKRKQQIANMKNNMYNDK